MLLARLLWPPSCPSASKSHSGYAFANTNTVHTTIRALYSVNISDNQVPDEQAQEIEKLIRRNRPHPVMQDSEKSQGNVDGDEEAEKKGGY